MFGAYHNAFVLALLGVVLSVFAIFAVTTPMACLRGPAVSLPWGHGHRGGRLRDGH